MRKSILGFSVAAIVFILEQITKWLVLGPLDLRNTQSVEVLPIFRLNYTENHGISLGLFQASSDAMRWVLVLVTAAIAVGVAWWIGREEKRWDQIALGMVLGGALGNILDRVRHGYVVDFADLHFGDFRPFFIFNVADAAISIGVAILLLRAFLVKDRPKENAEQSVDRLLLSVLRSQRGSAGDRRRQRVIRRNDERRVAGDLEFVRSGALAAQDRATAQGDCRKGQERDDFTHVRHSPLADPEPGRPAVTVWRRQC